MKFLFRAVSLCLILASLYGYSRAQDKPVMPEDVFPALKHALVETAKQSPRMVAANLGQLAADGDLKQAKSGLYPGLGGFYNLNKTEDRREDIPGTLESNKTYYSVSLNQPVFHWGERLNNARIGEIRRQIARENYAEVYRLLAQEIRAAYLSMVFQKIQLNSITFNKQLADQALHLAEEQIKKGDISEGAMFQPRMTADQSQLNLESAVWNYTVAKQNFATLTGLPEVRDDEIPDLFPNLPAAEDAVNRLLGRFLAQDEPNTAAVRIQRQNIRADDLFYRNQRTRLLPKLSFVVGMTQEEQSYTTNLAAKYGLQTRYVGLQVNWSIFDGFATRGAITSALARKRASEHEYKQLTERVARDAQRLAKTISLTQKQLRINERLLQNSGHYLDFTKGNFGRGQASEADVNSAQANYNSMLNNANNTRATYLLQVAEFVSSIGEDFTAVGVARD